MSTSAPSAPLLVVRRFGSDKTHVMSVARTSDAAAFGKPYQRPQDGRAACGVTITDGVVMREGTKTWCSACRHVTGIDVQPDLAFLVAGRN